MHESMSKNIKNKKRQERKRKKKKKKKKKEMDKVVEMSLFQYYENEIMFFNKKTDELLVETIMLEIQMAKRRKKRLRSTKKDIEQLKNMITMTLKAIAIVETYRLFQILEIVPTDENIQWFYVKREQCFKELLIIFLSKIKKKQQSNILFTQLSLCKQIGHAPFAQKSINRSEVLRRRVGRRCLRTYHVCCKLYQN